VTDTDLVKTHLSKGRVERDRINVSCHWL